MNQRIQLPENITHNQRYDIHKFEMSEDGGDTWERVKLPANSLPYHQCVLMGRWDEIVDGVLMMYRKV